MRCFEIKEAFQAISSLTSNNTIWDNAGYNNQLVQVMRSIVELIKSKSNLLISLGTAEELQRQAQAMEQLWMPELLQTLGATIGSLEILLDEAHQKTSDGKNISTERIEIAKTADFLADFAFLTCIDQDWLKDA